VCELPSNDEHFLCTFRAGARPKPIAATL